MAIPPRPDVQADYGLAVDVSRAEGSEAVAQLRREAQVLGAARHPGVVELVELRAEDGWAELCTVAVAGPPLESLLPLPAEELAGVVAGVATTLADLHGLGIVHGRIDGHRVLVRADGGPVLRGFGEGGRQGEPGPDGRVLDPRDDVEALGRLVARALEVPPAPDPWLALQARLPARVLGSWRDRIGHRVGRDQSPPAGEHAAAVLAELARAACDPDPASRPVAAEIAAAVHRRVPAARLPVPPVPPDQQSATATPSSPPARAPLRLPRRLLRVAVLVAMAGTAVAGARLAFGPSGQDAGPAPAAPSPSAAPGAPPSGPPAERVWPASADIRACPPLDALLRADVDGNGCEEALSFDRGILLAGTARYAVGGDRDVVATGDWDCDLLSTLALLRADSGEVWVFDAWAGPGQSLPGRRAGRVDGAVALEAVDADGDGCDELLARRADGSRQPVPASG
jgi:hypothetical protein